MLRIFVERSAGILLLAPALILTACAPLTPPTTQQAAVSRYPELVETAQRADSVVLAQVAAVDFSDPAADNFLTTIRARVMEVLAGQNIRAQSLCVRIPLGQRPDGQWLMTAHSTLISPTPGAGIQAGDQLLLFLSRQTYEEQVAARGGQPLADCTGSALGIARARDGIIEEQLSFPVPPTVGDLRSSLKE